MISPEELQHGLSGFLGTQNWYRHWSGLLLYTDGVKYLADEAQSHWLVDAIASYQDNNIIRDDEDLKEFQVWVLKVTNSQGELKCYTDNPEKGLLVIDQDIVCTNFPLSEIKLYVESGVLLLPSEH